MVGEFEHIGAVDGEVGNPFEAPGGEAGLGIRFGFQAADDGDGVSVVVGVSVDPNLGQ